MNVGVDVLEIKHMQETYARCEKHLGFEYLNLHSTSIINNQMIGLIYLAYIIVF